MPVSADANKKHVLGILHRIENGIATFAAEMQMQDLVVSQQTAIGFGSPIEGVKRPPLAMAERTARKSISCFAVSLMFVKSSASTTRFGTGSIYGR